MERLARRACVFAILLLLMGCGGGGGGSSPPKGGGGGGDSSAVRVPLTDMGTATYLGFSGGLYPNTSNTLPSTHRLAGIQRGLSVHPVDTAGNPSAGGTYVLLSIGMSNTTQEFCSGTWPECAAWSFIGQATADASVNHTALVIVDGATDGQDAVTWDSPTAANYDRIRDDLLLPQGLSELQVQAVWLKVADAQPTTSLPDSAADAYFLESEMGKIVRALHARYPNLKQVFASSRIYAGHATTVLNPEPYAYESGFSVKWLVEAQIKQMNGAAADLRAGDLNYNTVAPWIAWGPYLWADGTNPRSDGLVWTQSDFEADGTHPSQSGQQKVGAMLLTFFKTSSATACWFVDGGTCN